MKITSAKKQAALAVACALALGVFSATANAQNRDINETSLLVDSQGMPVMSGHGLCWHTPFGPPPAWNAKCHAAVPAPTAQYVAPAPAPVAAAPLPVYEKVSFEAKVLFDTDKAELRPAGRDKLDAFVSQTYGLESQSITAIGHADRMGTDGYNQTLSEERVNAVKSYLISKGVAADRIQTAGRGETQPTTKLSDCGDANNATNVACLQPDRNVFIEVSGSRIAK